MNQVEALLNAASGVKNVFKAMELRIKQLEKENEELRNENNALKREKNGGFVVKAVENCDFPQSFDDDELDIPATSDFNSSPSATQHDEPLEVSLANSSGNTRVDVKGDCHDVVTHKTLDQMAHRDIKREPQEKLNDSIDTKFLVSIKGATNINQNPLHKRPWIPEDFKVNELANNNIPYAYDEVIRGSKRRCLHGTSCLDCEKFYKLAGEIVEQPGIKWSDRGRSQVDQVSKHRNMWMREPSPPGFGRMDFPTSQEARDDREANNQRVYETTMRRFMEAVKPSREGRYVFRSEELNEMVQNGVYWDDVLVYKK